MPVDEARGRRRRGRGRRRAAPGARGRSGAPSPAARSRRTRPRRRRSPAAAGPCGRRRARAGRAAAPSSAPSGRASAPAARAGRRRAASGVSNRSAARKGGTTNAGRRVASWLRVQALLATTALLTALTATWSTTESRRLRCGGRRPSRSIVTTRTRGGSAHAATSRVTRSVLSSTTSARWLSTRSRIVRRSSPSARARRVRSAGARAATGSVRRSGRTPPPAARRPATGARADRPRAGRRTGRRAGGGPCSVRPISAPPSSAVCPRASTLTGGPARDDPLGDRVKAGRPVRGWARQEHAAFEIAVTTSHEARSTGAGRQQVVDRNWKVCSQSVAPGTTITKSTRIDFGTVELDEDCR